MKKKGLLLVAMVACLSLASMFTSLAGEWKQDDKGWWYVNDDGSYQVSNWQYIDGKWYQFDSTGYMSANITYETGYLGADGAWVSTKSPMIVMYAGPDEEIAYWRNLQTQYGIADLKYVDEGNGRFVYTVAKNKDISIPDYETVFASKACDDFNGFKYVISWDTTQVTFAVWDTDIS